MKRHYIVCQILSTLDGKIEGASFGTSQARAASGEYARIRDEYHADAWLYGTTTTKEFTAFRKPILQESGAVIPQGGLCRAKRRRPLLYFHRHSGRNRMGIRAVPKSRAAGCPCD